MPRQIPLRFRSPDGRTVLAAAALAAALGGLVGYADIQQQAERELALRQGPPPPVRIETFAPRRHLGLSDEVHVHGEIDLAEAVSFRLPGTEPAEWVALAPVYRVSPLGGAALAGGALSDGTPEQQPRHQQGERARRPEAVGLVVVPVPGPDITPEFAALAPAILGEGAHGTLVRLNGKRIETDDLALIARGALAARGVDLADDFLAIEPFLSGRAAAFRERSDGKAGWPFFMLALTLLAVAGTLQIRSGFGPATAVSEGARDDLDHAPPPPRRHPKFAPLASQGELRAADLVAAEKAAHGAAFRSGAARILAQAADTLGKGESRLFRSRRSRPEDEAP